MAEWFERQSYGAEIPSSVLVFIKLCQPSNKQVPFWNQDRIRQQKERNELRLPYAVHKIPPLPQCSLG